MPLSPAEWSILAIAAQDFCSLWQAQATVRSQLPHLDHVALRGHTEAALRSLWTANLISFATRPDGGAAGTEQPVSSEQIEATLVALRNRNALRASRQRTSGAGYIGFTATAEGRRVFHAGEGRPADWRPDAHRSTPSPASAAVTRPKPTQALTSALAKLAGEGVTDLTERARSRALPRAYGRDQAVEQVLAALAERRSVLLLGPNGVGKSAVLHEAIHRMDSGDAPPGARHKVVVQISTTSIEAGAGNTGGWGENLKDVLTPVEQGKDIFLWIDNICDLRDAGRYSGRVESMATFIKPYLDQKRIVLIGEGTLEQYTRSSSHGMRRGFGLADDPSLMKHFAIITLDEPDPPATRQIVTAVAEDLQRAHRVRIDGAVVDRAIALTRRFLSSQAFPGKAIHLLTDVARDHTAPPDAPGPADITTQMLMAGFARLTKLPEKLFSDSIPLAQHDIQSFFAERVIGQTDAVRAVADLVTLIKAELTDPTRPLGVLLFVGPTGTGKTWLAKTLAEYVFGSQDRLIRFDMSEYKYFDSVENLTRLLSERVRAQSFSVILLDEIEKAAPHVFDLFLQVFDDGRLSDPAGLTVDFRNTIVIMTSNLGAGITRRRSGVGVGFGGAGLSEDPAPEQSEAYVRAVEETFRPEFVNRLDRIVVFRPLDAAQARRIARRELGRALTLDGVTRRNILLDFREDVLDLVVSEGFNETYGARPLQRSINEHVLLPLARRLAAQPASADQLLELYVRNGRTEFASIPLHAAPRSPLESETALLESLLAPEPDGTPDQGTGMDLRQLSAAIAALRRTLDDLAADSRVLAIEERSRELLLEGQQPTFWDRPDRSRRVMATIYSLERIVDRLADLRRRAEALADIPPLIERHRDPTGASRLEPRYRDLARETTLLQLDILFAEGEPDASETACLSVTPILTARGPDSREWARTLRDMYTAWADEKGFEYSTVTMDGGDELCLILRGPHVTRILEGENGIHKRQGVAAGARQQRRASEVHLASVSLVPLHSPPAPPPDRDSSYEITPVTASRTRSPDDQRASKTFRAVSRSTGKSLQIEGPAADLPTLAATLLASREAPTTRGPASQEPVVRVYKFVGTPYVRDPRTGARAPRPKDVLDGAIDPFLLAHHHRPHPSEPPTP